MMYDLFSRLVLYDIFNMVDTDGNGTLSREEFTRYSERTGEEQVGDDEWIVVTGITYSFCCSKSGHF